MIELDYQELRTWFGFGVAGNFAGHLEQAGEAGDFVGIGVEGVEAPKGIFPWYVPEGGEPGVVPEFLHAFPISAVTVSRPAMTEVNLQIEPEVALLARVEYAEDGTVGALHPEAIGAFNDCSIRRDGAAKISHKKNWGAASKGLAARLLPVEDLRPEGVTATYRLACFLRRGEETHAYGIDSALPDYTYYGDRLIDWITDRLNHQQGAPGTPLESVGEYLRAAGNPDQIVVGIGATRYTAFGESTYLELGDDAIVIVYDASVTSPDEVAAAVTAGTEAELPAASVLRQRVVPGGPPPAL
jgi:hypothetical protein